MSVGGPTAAVIGLGLVGGSLARDLAERGWRVLGADADPASVRAAIREGVAGGFRVEDGPGSRPELIVVAVPVASVPSVLGRVRRWATPDAAITDVASTKRSVLEAAGAAGLGPRFVGSHPMAGDHRAGWAASRTGLFRDATVWLCPGDGCGAGVIRGIAEVWRELGARPAVIDPERHDRCVAWSSHLPQAVASALAAVLDGAAITRADLGPGGRDATRLAAGSPALWRDILMDNRDEVEEALGALVDELTVLRRALARGDDATLSSVLRSGRDWSRRV